MLSQFATRNRQKPVAEFATRILLWLAVFFVPVSIWAQSPPVNSTERGVAQPRFTWTETYEGSGNADGTVTELNSTFGYAISSHFSMDTGLSIYFVYPPSSKQGTTPVHGIGNPFLDMKYTTKSPILRYASTLTGAVPVTDAKKGFNTGRVTFDWDNRFDHEFAIFTPFLELGLANSIPDTRFFHRPFISLGQLAHFECGTESDLGRNITLTTSAYYFIPWGPQSVFSRLVHHGSVSPTAVYESRVFENNAVTAGGASLTRDAGVNLGFDIKPKQFVDLSVSYSYSAQYSLHTVSFGIGFDIAKFLRRRRGP